MGNTCLPHGGCFDSCPGEAANSLLATSRRPCPAWGRAGAGAGAAWTEERSGLSCYAGSGGQERADALAVGSGVLRVADLPYEGGGEWGWGNIGKQGSFEPGLAGGLPPN